jgi:2-polyprenyl-3-methyl-5-hydroxy-6-metoxy-1,4-benzoquinol methylase
MKELELLDARIPSWNMSELVCRNCPICNSKERLELYRRPCGLIVNICKSCSLKYISPAPSSNQIDEFYENYDRDHRPTKAINNEESLKDSFGSNHYLDLRIRKIASLIEVKESFFLDVGFGVPNVLFHLKQLGGKVYGLETDNQAISYARTVGLSDVFKSFDEMPEEVLFDCIILNDVIEHPLNPLQLLEACTSRLKPGGIILLWTPNGDHKSLELSDLQFRVDLEHMQYFNSESIQYLSSKLNLNLLHLETVGFPRLIGLISSNKLGGFRIFKKLSSYLKKILRHQNWVRFLTLIKIALSEYDSRKGSYHLFIVLSKKL